MIVRGTNNTWYEITADGIRTFAVDGPSRDGSGRRRFENVMDHGQFDCLVAAVQSWRDLRDAKPASDLVVDPALVPPDPTAHVSTKTHDALLALSPQALARKAAKMGLRWDPNLKGDDLHDHLVLAIESEISGTIDHFVTVTEIEAPEALAAPAESDGLEDDGGASPAPPPPPPAPAGNDGGEQEPTHDKATIRNDSTEPLERILVAQAGGTSVFRPG
jgi:hypothetical protein